jgi:hypothetical protein
MSNSNIKKIFNDALEKSHATKNLHRFTNSPRSSQIFPSEDDSKENRAPSLNNNFSKLTCYEKTITIGQNSEMSKNELEKNPLYSHVSLTLTTDLDLKKPIQKCWISQSILY